MTGAAARTNLSTLITALAVFTACGSEEPAPQGTGGRGGGGEATSGTGGTSGGTGGSVSAGNGGSVSAGSSSGGTQNAGAGGSLAGGGTGGTPSTGGTAMGGAGAGGTAGSGGLGDGGSATAGKGGSGGAGGASGAAGNGMSGAGGSPLAPVSDYAAPGPFGTSTENNTGPDGSYTIIRPMTLGANGFLHAPITFGPGTGMQVSQLSGLLQRFASHGFVVIGRQLDGGPRDPVTRMRMTAGLDWIIAQNSAAGSVYQGKLLVTKAVAMGYSVGGTGAVEVGAHPAVVTVVAIHGHQTEGALHGTALLIGGTEDVMGDGMSWLAPTYAALDVQTFFGTVEGADHGYIQGTVGGVPGGVETPAMVAWLRYWIYNDQGARRYFYGDDCVMCMSPWTNPQRKNWQ